MQIDVLMCVICEAIAVDCWLVIVRTLPDMMRHFVDGVPDPRHCHHDGGTQLNINIALYYISRVMQHATIPHTIQ